MLKEFRSQRIKWDKADNVIQSGLSAHEGDSNGRKLNLQITDAGEQVDLTGALVSLAWQTKNGQNYGLEAFEEVDGEYGLFRLVYPTGMLTNVGVLKASILLIVDGKRVESKNFAISVMKSNVNDAAVESENSFTALTEALVKVQAWDNDLDGFKLGWEDTFSQLESNYAPRLNDVTAQLAQKANIDQLPASAFMFKRTVEHYNHLPADGNEIGDQYRVTNENTNYAWNGTGWHNIGSFSLNDDSVNTSHLKEEAVSISKLEKVAGLNMYPLHRKATLSTNKLVALGIQNALKEVKLFGANPNVKYRIGRIRRNYPSGSEHNWFYINVMDENDLEVCRFTAGTGSTAYTEPQTVTKITLEERNASGINGHVWIDWKSFYDAQTNFWSLTYAQTGLDTRTYVGVEAVTSGGTTEVSIGTTQYPFKENSTINSDPTVKAKILDAIKEITLYGANKAKSYRISQLRRKRFVTNSGLNRWTIIITDSDNVDVAIFQHEPYNEPHHLEEVSLRSISSSGVTARIWIDWTKLPETVDLPGLDSSVMALDEKTFVNSIESQDSNRNFRDIREYHYKNVENSIPRIYEKQGYGTLTFPILTDVHTITDNSSINTSVEAMSYLAERVDVDFVANLGDFIVGDVGKPESLKLINDVMTLTKKHAKCPVFPVKGNHDSNDFMSGFSSKTDAEKRELLITNKEFYVATNKKAEKDGIVVDEANPYGGWYYVDFPLQKIRGIFLNTTEMDETDGIVNLPRYVYGGVQSQAQLDWLSNTALKFDGKENSAEWAVMMFSHVPPFTTEGIHNRGVDRPGFRAICEAFKDGTSGAYEETFATSVFDFTEQGPREFIGHFLGHVHEDSHTVINGINYFISNSVTPYKRWDTSLEREDYGENTLSSNTATVNREKRTVSIIKTGTGTDWEFTW